MSWADVHPCVPRRFCAAFFKGDHPYPQQLYTRAARYFDESPYSHGEVVFSDGLSASSTLMDKPRGVRIKQINFSRGRAGWDFVLLHPELEPFARAWAEERNGRAGYDLWGQAKFVTGLFNYYNNPDRWWCTEAMAAMLQRPKPGRYGPGGLAEVIADFRVPRALDLEDVFAGFSK